MMEEQTTLDGSEYIEPISNDWETPKELFQELNKEFNFTLDPCCTHETAKCEKYFTIADDGLKQSWKDHRVFMNCPYSDIPQWVEKASKESRGIERAELVVGLLPVWTDQEWFHEYVYCKTSIRFLQKRVPFLLTGKKGNNLPRFPSMIIIWR